MTKLSFITINYNNNKEGLNKTVEGFINQTWQEFEYIVTDGGSTDGSKELLDSYGVKIDYWVSEPVVHIKRTILSIFLRTKKLEIGK